MAPGKRILIVDDEQTNRELLCAMLTAQGYEAETAADGFEALAKFKLDFDLIMLDVMMPALDGFEVTHRIRQDTDHGDVPIIVVTSLSESEDRLRAVEAGANDFIAKPVDGTELCIRVASLIRYKEALDAIKNHEAKLEALVERRTADLRKAFDEAVTAHRETHRAKLEVIERLALAAEYKDDGTAAHIHRMSRYCNLMARKLHLPPSECEIILHASVMHDVGKIGIPDAVLLKPAKLTPDEWAIMKQHTTIGVRILGGSSSELLQAGEVIALSHHEKWDGTGYPNERAGDDIPLWGRICAVSDVFDALTSKRPYKAALPNEEALVIMRPEAGKHFDPKVLDAFLMNFSELLQIQREHQGH